MRRRTAARRAGHASRVRRVPAVQEPVGKDRDRSQAAFGSSVPDGSGGHSSEMGLPSSHLRKAATAVAVNRARPLSALANVELDKPSASAKRDCVPRFRARTPRSSNRSRSSGVGIEGKTSPKRPAAGSMEVSAEGLVLTDIFAAVAGHTGAIGTCRERRVLGAGKLASDEVRGLASRCISLVRVSAASNASPARLPNLGLPRATPWQIPRFSPIRMFLSGILVDSLKRTAASLKRS
jgi:hypothetical protein